MKKITTVLSCLAAFTGGCLFAAALHLERLVFAPTVSVVLPVQSSASAADLTETINSILASTVKDFEFIVVNDGATAEIVENLNSYDDERIKIITNAEEHGLPSALNQGFSAARGKYIVRTDINDRSYNDRLERQIEFMDNHNLDISTGALSDTKSQKLLVDEWDENTETAIISLYMGKIYNPTTMIVRRSFWNKHKLQFEKTYSEGGDFEVFAKAFLAGGKPGVLTGAVIGTRSENNVLNKFDPLSIKDIQTQLLQYLSPDLTADTLQLSECKKLEKIMAANENKNILEPDFLQNLKQQKCKQPHLKLRADFLNSLDKNNHFRIGNRGAMVSRHQDGIKIIWDGGNTEYFECAGTDCILKKEIKKQNEK